MHAINPNTRVAAAPVVGYFLDHGNYANNASFTYPDWMNYIYSMQNISGMPINHQLAVLPFVVTLVAQPDSHRVYRCLAPRLSRCQPDGALQVLHRSSHGHLRHYSVLHV
jgi:hypothetical protein